MTNASCASSHTQRRVLRRLSPIHCANHRHLRLLDIHRPNDAAVVVLVYSGGVAVAAAVVVLLVVVFVSVVDCVSASIVPLLTTLTMTMASWLPIV